MGATRICPLCLTPYASFETEKVQSDDHFYEIERPRTRLEFAAGVTKRFVMQERYVDISYPFPFEREHIYGPQRTFTCKNPKCGYSELVFDVARAKELTSDTKAR